MDYFVEGTLNSENTVIEKAAIARLDVFKQLARPAKLILMTYSPEWVAVIPKSKRSQVVSLFDVYQGVDELSVHLVGLNELDKTLGYYDRTTISVKKRLYHYTDGDKLIARVHLYPNNAVATVEFVGANEQTLEIDQYDVRGFLSRRQFWYAGRPAHEEYLDNEGNVRLEISFSDDNKVDFI